jgi:hypothetical protein
MFQPEFKKTIYIETFFKEIEKENFKPEELFSSKLNFLDFQIFYGFDKDIGYYGYLKNKYNKDFLFFILTKEDRKFKEMLKTNIKDIKSLNDFFNFSYTNFPESDMEYKKRASFWKKTKNEDLSFENLLRRAFSNWRISGRMISKVISFYIANKLSENIKEFTFSISEDIAKKHSSFLYHIIAGIWHGAIDKEPFLLGKNHVMSLILFRNNSAHLFKYQGFDFELYYEHLEKEYFKLCEDLNHSNSNRHYNYLNNQKHYTPEEYQRARDEYNELIATQHDHMYDDYPEEQEDEEMLEQQSQENLNV